MAQKTSLIKINFFHFLDFKYFLSCLIDSSSSSSDVTLTFSYLFDSSRKLKVSIISSC